MDDNRLADIERRLEDLDKRETASEKAIERSRAAMNSMIPPQTRHTCARRAESSSS